MQAMPPQTEFFHKGSMSLITLTLDQAEVRSTVESLHWLDGWPGVELVQSGLSGAANLVARYERPAMDYSRLAQRLWREASRQHALVVQDWLQAIDSRANFLCRTLLEESKKQIAATARRYFDKLADASFGQAGIDFSKASLRTTAGGPVQALQKALGSLEPSARQVFTKWTNTPPMEMTEHPGIPIDPSRYEERLARLAEYADALLTHQIVVSDHSVEDPLVSWVVGETAAEERADRLRILAKSTAELEPVIQLVLERAWRSAGAVLGRLDRLPSNVPAGSGGWPEDSVAASLSEGESAGVWRYPRFVRRAMEDFGWSAPSPQEAAVRRIYESSGADWSRLFQVTGAQLACAAAAQAVAAPLAAVVDLVFAGFAVFAAYEDYELRLDDHYAVFDPARSLAAPPDAWRIAGELIGAVFAPARSAHAVAGGIAGAMVGMMSDNGVPRWEP
jgi:hypothetical protein